jgi:peptide/nickel transport system substrate-binding protein
MKKLRWPLLIVFLALAAIGVLLLRQPTALLPTPSEEVKPAEGGIYTEGLIGSLNRLNPVLDLYHQADHDVDALIYSGLIRFDDRGLPVGDLAESWGISADGKVYNFSIRPNAKWHDGQPVTSADVVFTIDMMLDENSLLPEDVRELWNNVEVNPLGDTMVQFRLPEPFAPFLDYLSFGVLPSHLLDVQNFQQLVESSFNLQPVGSGPFRFNRLIVENGEIKGVELVTNPSYYGSKPFVEKFVFRYYPDAASLLAAYQAGEIMGLSEVPADILPQVLKEPNLNSYTGRYPELSMVFLNLKNPDVEFLKEPAIRRALLLGLNRQWMIDQLLNGQAIVADGPIFPGTWAFYDGIERLSYDKPAALNIIKEAGFTIPAEGGDVRTNEDGVRLELELLYPNDARHEAIAKAVQSNWQELGFGVSITPMSYDELVGTALSSRLYQAALVDINLTNAPDPDPYPFWHQTQASSGQNFSQWDDFLASEYMESARVTADMGERASDYKNFQVRFLQDLPSLPLFYPMYTYAVDSRVKGVSMGPLFSGSDRFATVTGWYLLEKRVEVLQETIIPTATPAP